MNKILITTVLVIFLVGTISGLAFGLNKEDFTKKIHKVNAKKWCDKNKELNKTEKKECKDLKLIGYNVTLNGTNLEIDEDPITGLNWVRATK